jgi:secondary thiamine-phosphate synthase enzyme
LVYSRSLEISTASARQAVDVTSRLGKVVADSGISEGLVLVFTQHTTTGLFINERESGLQADLESALQTMVPPNVSYRHDRIDDNAASHIQSIVLGTSLVLPVTRGRIDLGTWQSVFLAERDGPRTRTLVVKVIGDA